MKSTSLTMTILYVNDQSKSTQFYKSLLGFEPNFEVPGMTEFTFNNGSSLGLMPEAGIKKLLGENLPDPKMGSGIPRAELYLRVDDPKSMYQKSLELGAKDLSPYLLRNWGDSVAYSMDEDGHVLAFACSKQI